MSEADHFGENGLNVIMDGDRPKAYHGKGQGAIVSFSNRVYGKWGDEYGPSEISNLEEAHKLAEQKKGLWGKTENDVVVLVADSSVVYGSGKQEIHSVLDNMIVRTYFAEGHNGTVITNPEIQILEGNRMAYAEAADRAASLKYSSSDPVYKFGPSHRDGIVALDLSNYNILRGFDRQASAFGNCLDAFYEGRLVVTGGVDIAVPWSSDEERSVDQIRSEMVGEFTAIRAKLVQCPRSLIEFGPIASTVLAVTHRNNGKPDFDHFRYKVVEELGDINPIELRGKLLGRLFGIINCVAPAEYPMRNLIASAAKSYQRNFDTACILPEYLALNQQKILLPGNQEVSIKDLLATVAIDPRFGELEEVLYAIADTIDLFDTRLELCNDIKSVEKAASMMNLQTFDYKKADPEKAEVIRLMKVLPKRS